MIRYMCMTIWFQKEVSGVKNLRKRVAVLFVSALLCGLLTGCLSSSTVEELFTLPRPPIEYTDLSKIINQLITAGYEYASPTAGQNIQSVQMVDLDADGQEEAITFFRKPGDEKPLKIMVFHAPNESYELLYENALSVTYLLTK